MHFVDLNSDGYYSLLVNRAKGLESPNRTLIGIQIKLLCHFIQSLRLWYPCFEDEFQEDDGLYKCKIKHDCEYFRKYMVRRCKYESSRAAKYNERKVRKPITNTGLLTLYYENTHRCLDLEFCNIYMDQDFYLRYIETKRAVFIFAKDERGREISFEKTGVKNLFIVASDDFGRTIILPTDHDIYFHHKSFDFTISDPLFEERFNMDFDRGFVISCMSSIFNALSVYCQKNSEPQKKNLDILSTILDWRSNDIRDFFNLCRTTKIMGYGRYISIEEDEQKRLVSYASEYIDCRYQTIGPPNPMFMFGIRIPRDCHIYCNSSDKLIDLYSYSKDVHRHSSDFLLSMDPLKFHGFIQSLKILIEDPDRRKYDEVIERMKPVRTPEGGMNIVDRAYVKIEKRSLPDSTESDDD